MDPLIPSNVAASADPFYVFKDELETKVVALKLKHAKWKALLDATDLTSGKGLSSLTRNIDSDVASAQKSLKFIEQTIVMVESNRQKFEHIDNTEISQRKRFVSSTRMELLEISSEISSDSVKSRIQKEERKSLKPLNPAPVALRDDFNSRFLRNETQKQEQIMQQQDQSLEDLSKSVNHLNSVAVEINHEISSQNKMLEDLSGDVDEAHERLGFVMEKMSRLLKTKDRCQLGTIIFLVIVLSIMVFLVIYT